MRRFAFQALLPAAGALAVVAGWYVAALALGESGRLIPAPLATFDRCFEMLFSGNLNADLVATLWRWFAGFTLAVALGAPMGLFLGVLPRLYQASSLVLDFFRSLPVTALFPVFLVFFGIGNAVMIAMSFSATVFIIAIHAIYGVQSAAPTRKNMARSFGANSFQIFWRISAMEALHHILVGMRTALSLSLIVTIVSEMFIGASHGLGQRLYLSYQLQLVTDLFALILIVGALGYVANWAFAQFEQRIAYWVYP